MTQVVPVFVLDHWQRDNLKNTGRSTSVEPYLWNSTVPKSQGNHVNGD